jgi:hypothetical protein
MPPSLLTPLQVEATQLFFSLPHSAGFAVAGGAALIVQGLIHRQTRDVDLFLIDAAASTITSATASFETAISKRGWSHQRVIDQSDFVRLLITGSRESLIVDLGRDSPAEEPVDATDLGPTLSLRDLAARKTWPCSAAPKPGTSPTSTISPADSAATSSSTGPPTTTQDSTTRSSPTCSPASSGSATRTCQCKPGAPQNCAPISGTGPPNSPRTDFPHLGPASTRGTEMTSAGPFKLCSAPIHEAEFADSRGANRNRH